MSWVSGLVTAVLVGLGQIVLALTHTRMHACVYVCMHARMHTCIRVYMHTCMHTCTHVSLSHTYILSLSVSYTHTGTCNPTHPTPHPILSCPTTPSLPPLSPLSPSPTNATSWRYRLDARSRSRAKTRSLPAKLGLGYTKLNRLHYILFFNRL